MSTYLLQLLPCRLTGRTLRSERGNLGSNPSEATDVEIWAGSIIGECASFALRKIGFESHRVHFVYIGARKGAGYPKVRARKKR